MKSMKRALALAIAVLALGACAKKDGNFNSKNSMGTRAKNTPAAQAALDSGLKIDFFDIHTVSTSPMQFSVDLMVNDLHTVASIQQYGTQVSSGQTSIGSYQVKMDSICLNTQCNPLVLSAIAYQGSQPYGQVVYMFMRQNADASGDRYQIFPANEVKSNMDLVVNYLVFGPDVD